MKKRKLVLLGVAAVALILLLGAVAMLIVETRDLGKTEKALSSAKTKLDGLYAHDPFPSASNVSVIASNTVQVREWRGNLKKVLSENQTLPDEKKSPAAFISDLSESRIRLVRKAGAAVPETFAFGFDRYFEAESAPPESKYVPRLVQQLRMIETIVTILFEERVSRLSEVTRVPFEIEGKGGGNPDEGLIKEGELYSKFHFGLEFAAQEPALTAVLNRLAALQPLTVVTRVGISKLHSDILSPRIGDDENFETDPTSLTNAIPSDARVVSGIEVAKPFSVNLELDVYWFREGDLEGDE